MIVRSNIFISDDIETLKKHKSCARRVIEVNGTNEKAITMLKRGRGNLLVMSEPFWHRFKTNEPELVAGMTTLPLKLWPDPLAIGFNRNIAQQVMDKVNQQIQADIERGYIPCNLHSPED